VKKSSSPAKRQKLEHPSGQHDHDSVMVTTTAITTTTKEMKLKEKHSIPNETTLHCSQSFDNFS